MRRGIFRVTAMLCSNNATVLRQNCSCRRRQAGAGSQRTIAAAATE